MPGYPAIVDQAAINSVAGYLANVARIEANLRILTADRFVADRLFAPPPASTAGASAVSYGQVLAGGQFLDADVEAIRPGAAFPRFGVAQNDLAAMVEKYGGEVPITWEERDWNRTDVLARSQTQLANTVVRRADSIALDALAAAPTNSLVAGVPWATATGAQIVANLVDAVSLVNDNDMGYEATIGVFPFAVVAAALKNKDVRDAITGVTNPTMLRTRSTGPILGLDGLIGTSRLPAGTGYIAAGRQVGSLAGDPAARAHRYDDDHSQSVIVQGWRRIGAFVTDPLAATRLTGL